MSFIKSCLASAALTVAVALASLTASPAMADTEQRVNYKIVSGAASDISTRDLQCLSEALYFEARGEGSQGQRAVAEVILNRVDHPRFPKTVCGVVNQSGQFTYKKTGIREKGAFFRAQKIAKAALQGAPRNLTSGATYFHTGHVKPSWSKRFERTARIGSHIFYRSGQRLASN